MTAVYALLILLLIAFFLKVGNVRRFLSRLAEDERRRWRYGVVILAGYLVGLAVSIQLDYIPWAAADFTVYYTGARLLRNGYGQRLYDLALQARVQQEILSPSGVAFPGGLLPYNYPPFVAAAFLPLSFLPLRCALLIWNVLSLGLILASLALLVGKQGGRLKEVFVVISVVTLFFFPVPEMLVKGQNTSIVLLALALTYWALKRDRGYLAGAALALGLIKPQLVALVVILLVYRRAWRAVVAFCSTASVLVAVSWALVGRHGLRAYVTLLRQMSGWGNFVSIYPESMANLRGTVYRAALLVDRWFGVQLTPFTLTGLTAALSLGVLVLMFRSWRFSSRGCSEALDLQFAATLLGGLLLSPHLYGHDLSLLVAVGWLLLRHAHATGRGTQARWIIAAAHPAPLILSAARPYALGQQILAFLMVSVLFVLARWSAQDCSRPSTCSP